jgi:hypothetical protein
VTEEGQRLGRGIGELTKDLLLEQLRGGWWLTISRIALQSPLYHVPSRHL